MTQDTRKSVREGLQRVVRPAVRNDLEMGALTKT